MKKHLVLLAGLALAGLSTSALAQGNGFVRFEAGRSNIDTRVDGVGSANDHDTTWGVRGGYWFNPNFAVEGFYNQVADYKYNDGFDTYDVRLHGVGAGIVAKKNFGGDHKGFFIGGRAGIARGVVTVEVGNSVEADSGSAKPYFGVNAGYDFNERFGLSLNYDRLKSSDGDTHVTAKTLTLGFEARF